jgi:hypothetical protein
MSLEWIRVSLRGTAGARATGNVLFELLALTPADGFAISPSDSVWKAARIVLVEVAAEDVKDTEEPSETFSARIREGLLRAAEWLNSRPPGAFDRCRAEGFKLDLFIGDWLDGEQFDLDLPAEFLLACGRVGLPITICTND